MAPQRISQVCPYKQWGRLPAQERTEAKESRMMDVGSPLPDFELGDVTSGELVSASYLQGRANVVAFLCNHCPYVVHIRAALRDFSTFCKREQVPMLGICSNDAVRYPQDGPRAMAEEVQSQGYCFPYLFDETQEVARNFGAACTPDFFVYDASGHLAYRGQFDGSRPVNDVPVTGDDLRAAVRALLDGAAMPAQQLPSIGCGIKWRE